MAEADPTRGTEPTSDALLFHRRIEFHLARRPFNGLGNNGNGFKLVTLNPNTVTHKASGSDKKCEKTVDNYEAGLDPELRLEITFRRIGAGLRNLGNTCFLNSVLQCLTYTEPLVAYLQSGKHQNSCRTSGFCALCAIQKHVSRALQSTGRILEPKDLVSNLRCISRNFRIARQEDAHEYMVNLLESMHKCCLPSGVLSESPGAYEKSLVHKIFGGHLRSQVKCMQCSYCSNKFDPFLDLSLEIVKADSLVRALAHFTAKEQLDGGAKQYQCEQCRQKVKALKQLTIHKAPHVLTVHLKRFGSQSPGQKIDKKVTFGSTLDLKPFVTGSYDGDLTYTLYGVLVHAGWSTRSGHYYCFVRTSSGMWYSLDDNQVFQVNERKVLEQKAYMLFYVRDRKDFVPRKPVKVIPKENMLMGATGNEVYSKLDMELEGKMRNRTIDKKSDLSASLALSRRDSLLLGSQKGTTDSEILFPNGNRLLSVDYEGHRRGPHSEISLTALPSNGPLKDHNILNSNSLDHIGGSIITGGDSVDTRNLNGAAENVSNSNVARVLDDLNASGVKLPEHIAPQDSANKKGSIDVVVPSTCEKETALENLCRMGRTNSGALGNTIVPMQIVFKEATEVKHMKSLQKSSIEAQSRAGGPSEKICVSSFEDNHENGQRAQPAESDMSSSLVGLTQNMQHEKSKDRRPERKRKRKLLRCNVPAMSFTSNIIFGLGLGVRKKKPKKLRKEKKNLDNMSDANDLPSIPGPSMAEKSAPSPDDSSFCLQKENSECCSIGKNQNLSIQNMSGHSSSVLSDDVINNNYSERVTGETTLFSERQALRNPIDVMSMLMKGLDETTVAGWDDSHVSPSEELETRATRTTAQIGFVGDEWDEEYDRGKRKKLRSSKIDFSGPNLFQEIAAKNSMRKAAKLNRALNQPFRI